jgi:hypothetical protein
VGEVRPGAVVLGGIGLAFAGADLTAFSAVNFTVLPTTARWLWPTLIGAPLIAVWITYYKTRFRRAIGRAEAPAGGAAARP